MDSEESETIGISIEFEVFRIRKDVLDRLLPDVPQGVLEVLVWVEPVDDRRPYHREKRDRVSGACLAARGLENLPGDDEGLDAPLGQVVRKLEIGFGKIWQQVVPYLPDVVQRAFQGASLLGLRAENQGLYAVDYGPFLAFPDVEQAAAEKPVLVGFPLDFEERVHLGHHRERDGLRPGLLGHSLDDVGELPPRVGPAPLQPHVGPALPEPVVAGVVVAFDPSGEIVLKRGLMGDQANER